MKHDNTKFKDIISTYEIPRDQESDEDYFATEQFTSTVLLLCFIIVEAGFSFEEKHEANPY